MHSSLLDIGQGCREMLSPKEMTVQLQQYLPQFSCSFMFSVCPFPQVFNKNWISGKGT
jgi:hypothetical protein